MLQKILQKSPFSGLFFNKIAGQKPVALLKKTSKEGEREALILFATSYEMTREKFGAKFFLTIILPFLLPLYFNDPSHNKTILTMLLTSTKILARF